MAALNNPAKPLLLTLPAVCIGLMQYASLALGQEYIDLEAERRQQTQSDAVLTGQDNSSQTSLGQSDPNQNNVSNTVTVNPSAPIAGSAGEMFYQMQLLQQEVMELRGRLEEQEYQLKQLREQSLEQYLDLDQRLKGSAGAVAEDGDTTEAGASETVTLPAVRTLAGEEEAYRAAYGLVRSQQFDSAVTAFRQFLVDFPGGRYTPNAHYWLGELYLVLVPPDDESARREFTRLLEQYPNNSKVPDALYKLGKIYYERGNRDRAQAYLQRVVNEFANSGSSAVRLAQDFLSSNF